MFSEITRTELLNLGKKISDGLNSEGLKWIKSFTSKLEGNNPKNALTKNDYQGLELVEFGLKYNG
jgi:hypothetical protein